MFTLAALGGEFEVPTLHGNARLKIPAGTKSGARLRMRGQGIKTGERTGDQLVAICIFVPETLTDEQRELLEQLHASFADSDLTTS